MTREEVVRLMASSKSEEQWNENCAKVKEASGDYPPFWNEDIVSSGVLVRALDLW